MLLPRPKDARRPTMLELFFDLVYVVVLALISQRLESGPGWVEALHALILLMALWWVWAITVLVSNLYDPQHPLIQLTTLCALVGSLLMTAAIPTAFGPHGVVFASAYVGIHLTRGFLLAPALRGQPEAWGRAISVLAWFTVSGAFWMAGGVSDGTRRVVLWVVALGIDGLGFGLRFPVPRLRRLASSRFFVVSDHLAERLQQFFIISLGDAILIIGLAMSQSDFDAQHLAAFAVTLGSTVLLWRIYRHRAGQVLPTAIETIGGPNGSAQGTVYSHLVMMSGVVVTAASFSLAIHDPAGAVTTAWVLIALGGPALFLAGRARFEYEVFRRVSPQRVVAIVVLAAAVPGARHLPALAVTAVGTLVLAGVAVADTMRGHGRPAESPAPAR